MNINTVRRIGTMDTDYESDREARARLPEYHSEKGNIAICVY